MHKYVRTLQMHSRILNLSKRVFPKRTSICDIKDLLILVGKYDFRCCRDGERNQLREDKCVEKVEERGERLRKRETR